MVCKYVVAVKIWPTYKLAIRLVNIGLEGGYYRRQVAKYSVVRALCQITAYKYY